MLNLKTVNACGDCTCCCTIMGVSTLEKPQYMKCYHEQKGCAVYEQRPEDCREYSCLWLLGMIGDERHRPDKIGLIFDVGNNRYGSFIVAWECLEDAHQKNLYLLEKLAKSKLVVVRRYNKPKKVVLFGTQEDIHNFIQEA